MSQLLRRVSARQVLYRANRIVCSSQTTIRHSSTENKPQQGFVEKYFGVESNVASAGFSNRWLMTIPAFGTHMCLGAPYAWSLMADAVTREIGFVAPVSSDWSIMETALPLSMVFVLQGVCAALFGKWQLKVGPRKAMAAAAVCFGGGVMVGAGGVFLHSLPLLYLGYGFLGGTGIGLGYTPPVQALMQWFPDKKGVASGLTIAGFGSAALLFTSMAQPLMKHFAVMPKFLGPASNFSVKLVDGKLLAEIDGKMVEVVQAGAAELAKLPYDLAEGFYLVGSGSTGVAETLLVLGAGYFVVMMASALAMKRPHESYRPPAPAISSTAASKPPVVVPDVSIDNTMKAPQFYLMGLSFMCLATGGIGMFSVAKPMMSEVFSAALPAVVTSAFASKYLMMLSAGNLGGRIGWAAVSDIIGRKKTMAIFAASSVALYSSVPTLVDTVLASGSVVPLAGFCACTALAVSIMGGTYAILPAYEADLFGSKFVGAIHGRMLLFSSAAAIAGPTLLLKLRAFAEREALEDLLKKVSPDEFFATFGTRIEEASTLIDAKLLTIHKLLALAPPGTLDPSPHLYDTTMYTLGSLMTVALVSNYLVKPLSTHAQSKSQEVVLGKEATRIVSRNESDAPKQ